MVMSGLIFCVYSQNPTQSTQLHIQKSISPIVIDGVLDEEAWEVADEASGFYLTFPVDDRLAEEKTIVKTTYDDKYFYVGAICYTSSNEYMIESLRRDFSFGNNDVFAIYIDPYNDQSNGFSFQVTPYNVQREGLVTLGGDVSDNWDNKWYSEVTRYNDRYVVEMAIPFKSFRYNSVGTWNINFLRNHPLINQRSTWIYVPIQFRSSDLNYSGKLVWDTPPKPTNSNIALIPYNSVQIVSDYENNEGTNTNFGAGLDAKIGLSPSLNLDVTINPDFSQVEVDQQVNNLGRFEISFPERRQFFLENQDLFAQNGFPLSRPFFSRRIGIIGSGANAKQIPILGGARLSGKIGKEWRVGMLNIQTGEDHIEDDENGIEFFPGQNYTVAVAQRQLGRSNLGATLVNRTGINYNPNDTTITSTKYNRVVGFDYNLATTGNKWEGNTYVHKSLTPGINGKDYSHGAFLGYRSRELRVGYFHVFIGENYQADVGFVPRTGVNWFGGFANYSFWTEQSDKVINHGPAVDYNMVTNSNLTTLDRVITSEYGINFRNTIRFEIGYDWNSITLTDSFAPNGIEADSLEAGGQYQFGSYNLFFRTDTRKLFTFNTFMSNGKFYNGERTNIRMNFGYRIQPVFRSTLRIDYNNIRFDEQFQDIEYLLIGTRLDLTLTNKLFLTSFLQYNDRDDNFNVNMRLQWRFKPVSDLFLVYTENYGGDVFTENVIPRFQNGFQKNRAIVMKITYWLNL